MSETKAHQGVIAQITPFKYSTVEDILDLAKSKNEDPFIVILDELEDPHNLGSIVRTAELCGAHGIIIPKRRNVGVTGTVYKASGRGMSNLTKKKCDKLVKIPMVGKINSLNASVAGGIMMYEVLKSRIIK